MNNLKIIFFGFFFITSNLFSQEIQLDENLVGFSCGGNGKSTKLVEEIIELVNSKKYDEIETYLNSKNTGKIYLSIIVLERLSVLEIYKLSEKTQEIIRKFKDSPFVVMNCYGCLIEYTTMKTMFSKDDFIGSKEWIEQKIISEKK